MHAVVKTESRLGVEGTICFVKPWAIRIAHMESTKRHVDKRMMMMVSAKLRRMTVASWHLAEIG